MSSLFSDNPMESAWFYALPDFRNSEKWIEDRPMDFAADEDFSKVIVRTLGSAPDHLYLGMIIRRRNKADPKLIIDEFRLPGGKGPIIVRWWVEGDEGRFGIAARLSDGSWRVCSSKEVPCWFLNYNKKKKKMTGFGLNFKEKKS